jgi:putative DNA primase/helicase
MAESSAPAVAPPVIENIPEQLTERPQWVCWRLEERAGKATKVPYIAGTERRASSTDLMTWSTFSEALEAYERSEPPYDGIGFVFCSADPFVGIDIDDCRDPESGEISRWAQKIIDSFASSGYVEASPSGTGVHIIVTGSIEEPTKTKHVEIYDRNRYFTISGEKVV